MKKLFILVIILRNFSFVIADIAPAPIIVKGIYTINYCKIQLVSEIVNVDMTNDSAKVECIFNLVNWGDSITIDVGFPEMNFQYWGISQYTNSDKRNFKIQVDNKILTEAQIGVPKEMEKLYKDYMSVYYYNEEYKRKNDSVSEAYAVKIKENRKKEDRYTKYNELKEARKSLFKWRESKPHFGSELWCEFNKQMEKKNFPWYIWKVKFDKNEKKTIKVVYKLPSGIDYGVRSRYFKYLLNTGAGWYGNIEKAEINAQLHNIIIENLEEITPANYKTDSINKTIAWKFENFKPTEKDDIYIKYYIPKERKRYEQYEKKRKRNWDRKRRMRWLRYLYPVNWFRNRDY